MHCLGGGWYPDALEGAGGRCQAPGPSASTTKFDIRCLAGQRSSVGSRFDSQRYSKHSVFIELFHLGQQIFYLY